MSIAREASSRTSGLAYVRTTADPDDFKAAFRRHAGGVAVITADNGSRMVALTATSVSSVSVEPNLLMFSVSESSSSAPVLKTARSVVVHILDAEDVEVAQLAATSGIDRFADTSRWARLTTGEPLYHGVQTWIRGRVVNRVPAGTATLIVVEATQVSLPKEGRAEAPLVHHDRAWHQLGEESRL